MTEDGNSGCSTRVACVARAVAKGGIPVWLAHPSFLCCATVGPSRNSTTIQNLTRVGLSSPSRRRGDLLSAPLQPVAARSVFLTCQPPPSDTTASGASSGSPHMARPTAATASPAAATSPSAVAATSLATGVTPGSATCTAVRRDDVAAVPAPASPATNLQ